MQNTIYEKLKTKHSEHKSSSPTFTLIWAKSKSKPYPTWTALSTIVAGILIIAFAFFNSDAFLKELIASGLLIGISGVLQWMECSAQRSRTDYHQNNLN